MIVNGIAKDSHSTLQPGQPRKKVTRPRLIEERTADALISRKRENGSCEGRTTDRRYQWEFNRTIGQ